MKLRTKRQVMELCGDVLDRFPCRHCGAKSPNECRVPIDQRKAATDAINNPVRNALPVEDHAASEIVS